MSKSRKYKSDFGLGEIEEKPRSKKYDDDDDKKSRSKDESRSKKSDKYDDDYYDKKSRTKEESRTRRSEKYDDEDKKSRSKEESRTRRSERYEDEDKNSRSKDESKSRSKSDKYDDDEKSKHRSKTRDYDDDYKKSESKHRSKNEDDDYRKSESKHRSKNDDERHRSKYKDDDDDYKKSRDDDSKSRHKSKNKDEEKTSKSRYDEDDEKEKKRDKERRKKSVDEIVEEYNYDDDFDDDFENESEDEPKKVEVKTKKTYDSEEEDYKKKSSRSKDRDYDNKRSSKTDRYADEEKSSLKSDSYRDEGYKNSLKSRSKYEDYDDFDDYKDSNRGRVVKANALVKIPTDSVEVFSSKIYYNHDSGDRQRRRAKDLFKNLIELDKKGFSLLDINPTEMRTVYSAHLRHEKIQTNDDNFEIECQTDEIELVTRWTQNPAEDSKGYGIENEKFSQENSEDILQKFRVNINTESLHKFLENSSKVIEKLLKSDFESNQISIENTKTDFEMSQGYTGFELPKPISKLFKHYRVTQCSFNRDDPNYFVCSYNLPDESNQPSLLIAWNLMEPKKPYRVLSCETVSTCLNYVSFMVMSGNLDGSICLWDLREPFSIHAFNSKNKSLDETSSVRSPTYITAGVFLNENHMSEVRTIINLQNQKEKNIFMQIASLEIEGKLIIWTVIEIKNSDLTVFETDLGLLPGGKLKIVKSSQIVLNNIIWSPFGKNEYQTLNMTNSISQPNHFFIATNIGQIIHINRKGAEFSISVMKSNYSDSLLIVTDVAFHHELSDLLLACYGNGEIRLYHTSYVTPIKTWNLGCLGRRIKEVKWIESRSSCFSIVDEQDNFYVWDLLLDDTQPVLVKQLNEFGGVSYSQLKKQEEPNANLPFAFFKNNSKEVEVHLFNKDWVRKSDKELKKFSKLIKNYLISF